MHYLSIAFRLTVSLLLLAPLTAQTATRVSVGPGGVEGNGDSLNPSMDFSGNLVAFDSSANNLVPGDVNGFHDIFLRNRSLGSTSLVSLNTIGLQANGGCSTPSINQDGSFISFQSTATNLVSGDVNGRMDVFLRDLTTGVTTLVSVSSAGLQGNANSYNSIISGDGRYVAFISDATNLVAGDTNGATDVFVRDTMLGVTWRASMSSFGTQGNSNSGVNGYDLSVSGRYVAFPSTSSNLVPNDTNQTDDIFLHDNFTGQTILVSRGLGGVPANSASYYPCFARDGSVVGYISTASNLVVGDNNGKNDAFVCYVPMGATERASVNTVGVEGNDHTDKIGMSEDGSSWILISNARNLVQGDHNGKRDAFVRRNQVTTLISANMSGDLGNDHTGYWYPTVSFNGRIAAFDSDATNLVPGDTNSRRDTFVRDFDAGPSLTATGSCPGVITLWISEAVPGATVFFLSGAAGVYSKLTPPCQGLRIDISAPVLSGIQRSDLNGQCSLTLTVSAGGCSLTYLAVQLVNCRASNVVVM